MPDGEGNAVGRAVADGAALAILVGDGCALGMAVGAALGGAVGGANDGAADGGALTGTLDDAAAPGEDDVAGVDEVEGGVSDAMPPSDGSTLGAPDDTGAALPVATAASEGAATVVPAIVGVG